MKLGSYEVIVDCGLAKGNHGHLNREMSNGIQNQNISINYYAAWTRDLEWV